MPLMPMRAFASCLLLKGHTRRVIDSRSQCGEHKQYSDNRTAITLREKVWRRTTTPVYYLLVVINVCHLHAKSHFLSKDTLEHGSHAIEVPAFKYEVKSDSQGCLEAAVASDVAKRVHRI